MLKDKNVNRQNGRKSKMSKDKMSNDKKVKRQKGQMTKRSKD